MTSPPFTYPEVGATAGTLPTGYGTICRTRTLSRTDFDQAVAELMSWQVHTRAGLRMDPTTDAAPGVDVVMRLLTLKIPCRVVYVVDEPDRRGFAYGTLAGHPETGEEAFLLERRADGSIDFTVTVFSKPATTLARLGGPLTSRLQQWMTTRYLQALDRP